MLTTDPVLTLHKMLSLPSLQYNVPYISMIKIHMHTIMLSRMKQRHKYTQENFIKAHKNTK